MEIRLAEEHNAPAIAASEWLTAGTPGLLVGRPGEIPLGAYSSKIEALRPLGSYWVAEAGGRLVGHAFLDPLPMRDNAHVFTLTIVVHPANLGQGVGTALMTRVMAWARERPGLGKIELLVRATNTRAIALYRKFGFAEEGRLRRRVKTPKAGFIDDLVMSWFPNGGSEGLREP